MDNFDQAAKERRASLLKDIPCENRDGNIFASKRHLKHVCGGIAFLAMVRQKNPSPQTL